MPDPAAYLRRAFPTVRVLVRNIGELWGLTEWDEDGHPTVYVSPLLNEIELRCTLAHELQHIEHGPPHGDYCDDEERHVDVQAAKWLLPDVVPVAQAVALHDVGTAARVLRVLPHVLLDRIGNLGPSERRHFARLMPELV